MSFHLSPASLVDQRGSDYPSLLLLPNSALPSSASAYGNFSLSLPLNNTIPQIFVVNPTSDNIFRHVNTESAHAAIIGLIYFSMWMGALGWDIVSTIPFDVRLIKETTWSSSFSSIYSIAYLLSRYVSLTWLITAVTNSVIMTNRCDAWMKGSTALFSIAISATMLVFCLRTCSIWHMKQKIVSLVVSSWFLVVAFAVLLPVMSYGDQLPTSNFCAWHFNGLYVVGVFGALLLFDLLCLILTVCKLNKAGWRGLINGLFPSSRINLDAEDVKTMLVQKTTAFFAIQFLFLISALLVYVLTDTYAYRMMNIVASVAVASSMAGRIFRRAWRQTRELAPHNINRPPSYFPAWAEEHRDAPFHRHDDSSSCGPGPESGDIGRAENGAPKPLRASRNNNNNNKHDSLAFYVEGEFGPKLKSRSTSSQSLRSLPRTPVSSGPTQQMREMETGQVGMHSNMDAASITPSTMVITRSDSVVPTSAVNSEGPGASLGDNPAPAYSGRLGSAISSRPHTGDDATHQPPSAGEMFSLHRGTHLSAPNMQGRLGTADSQALSVNSSLISFSSLSDDADTHGPNGSRDIADRGMRSLTNPTDHGEGGLIRDDDLESDDQHGFVMEEKRRTFITSPPLTARVRLNSKEVYDVDSVKAAARLGARQGQLHNAFARPATASSVSTATSSASPSQSHLRGAADEASRRRCDTGGGVGQIEPMPCGLLREDTVLQDQATPRPKTAPSWPSPSLSPSESVASQMTLMPRDFGTDAAAVASPSALSSPAPMCAADDDVLLAFLNTVEQDSRDRARDSCAAVASPQESSRTAADEGRPRTARGNTASSSCDTDEGEESDLSTILGHGSDRRGRRASSSARPRSAVSSRGKGNAEARASSSAGPRKRLGTSESNRSDGSGSGTRPSTAVGDSVKPFGFGVLRSSSRRGSRVREGTSFSISDDEEGEAEAELGSVIQQQYAKLAARAQMPLDPPY
ncbi:uncharacterized protein UTRI_06627_B [Ustilago trichophora]|uniref:Transmembrane protein n=1 Tax=Ustilago trichophora TaxID=86804 RepID=A0A5C3ELZ1_9BASI|nr:uncharacterized protein UTRI_06627_B [Ustilago trichophora]